MAQQKFRAKVWKWDGPAGWYFVTVPKVLTKKIREKHGSAERGWGQLKTTARLGTSKWATAIWFDSRRQSYLLPIKAAIRGREKIEADSMVTVALEFAPMEDLRALKKRILAAR